jgi:hypothetical protein
LEDYGIAGQDGTGNAASRLRFRTGSGNLTALLTALRDAVADEKGMALALLDLVHEYANG